MPEKLYDELIEKIKRYHPSEDFTLVEKAYNIAKTAHGSQVRKSGEPYLIHPVSVANILADLELDKESIVAGMLHDVVEDTDYTTEDIAREFNEEIAILVDGVTKLTAINYSTEKEEVQAENYRKMFLAMAKDIRVILIKLADRLHNMRTLKYMPENKQREKAKETLDIYAPLAHRLGISTIKAELEDLSLRYLDKDAYYDIYEKIARKRNEREAYVEEIVKEVKTALDQVGIQAEVDGRPKHFFSIYKKMVNQNKSIDQIYDLFAVRAIVESVKDCYGVLGIIHELYKPVPGRFKDYIAMPKPNMYQSLHTTLIDKDGEPFEMQIRTFEMHRTAEFGIAAHWKYKEGKTSQSIEESAEKKLNWLRQILEWQRDMSDNKEFMDVLKSDLDVFNEQVYAFTPTGDVVDLPMGSTPIDFAYHIHSAVGNKMVGARVNGKIVTFDYRIRNGDRVEIITSQNSKGPSRDWLHIVKSSQAKNKINQWFRKEFKEENIIRGKEMLEKYVKAKGMVLSELMRPEFQRIVQAKYGFKDWDSVTAAIGHGGLKEGQVVNRLHEELQKLQKSKVTAEDILQEISTRTAEKPEVKRSKSGIMVKGIEDLAVRFSRCCTPVPGDEIIGFITRGRGVSIHRTDCVNIINLNDEERHRLIEAEWHPLDAADAKTRYTVEIQVVGYDRVGLLVDISKTLTDAEIPVKSLNARTNNDQRSVFNISVEISSVEQLKKLTKKLRHIEGVVDIIRSNN
ncbi:RelA/SpoT family protein [Anaerotalea alkaliphila]|uniref:GTP diphosphokinase n=1 Tax=Anaerotalea alkaliphila TaxID=2662126 RepID=A0A7X5HVU3_9FIRM|nr:bifunctional (p)ppGpp synthetase/guanosine-3',5'-bis(diphosphate) 3'-pyrophosphohydrolase [Anaerotalea alkaliphila]NDL67598.1 bifunctional (p)ppGpp synthetase/guanosine-3',5'-bis(diphosphate) 3'-pyrophosphohydrolase [Anaerotalea alkaliphila]